jgi:hypothetical protein
MSDGWPLHKGSCGSASGLQFVHDAQQRHDAGPILSRWGLDLPAEVYQMR